MHIYVVESIIKRNSPTKDLLGFLKEGKGILGTFFTDDFQATMFLALLYPILYVTS